MSKNPLKLKIAYLYPDILQGLCDKSNVEVFLKRAKWRDIDATVQVINKNDKVLSNKFDFFYIGGSNTEVMADVIKYLKQNQDEIAVASALNVPILAVNCGYQLLGNYFQLHNTTQIDGLGVLDVDSIATNYCYSSSVVGICEFLQNKTIAGHENHTMITYLKSGVSPFITLTRGNGNNAKDKTEGARFNNTIGTYITSPLLAQNPHFCDFLISQALRIKYNCRIPLTPLCDDIEWFSHNDILETK